MPVARNEAQMALEKWQASRPLTPSTQRLFKFQQFHSPAFILNRPVRKGGEGRCRRNLVNFGYSAGQQQGTVPLARLEKLGLSGLGACPWPPARINH